MSEFRQSGTPLIANFGGGVDSTAMLVEMMWREIVPDFVVFADTGSEKPETYAHVATFSAWLVDNGMPPVTMVRRAKSRPSKTGPGYSTIEGNCLQNKTLPSLAFGRKSCSSKWKAQPMDAWLERQTLIRAARARGVKPVKLIGYDCGPADSRRAVNKSGDAKFIYRYPLREWGWDRERCIAEIRRAGLEPPIKSACYFCPASKKPELLALSAQHRDLFERALALEDAARPSLRTIKGLGRNFSWRDWAETAARRGEIEPLPLGLGESVDLVAMVGTA